MKKLRKSPVNENLYTPKFDRKSWIFEAVNTPFELKIHLKVSLSRPKIKPKQLRKVQKTAFWTLKTVIVTRIEGQNWT